MKRVMVNHLRNGVEAALFAAEHPLTLDQLVGLFAETDRPDRTALRRVVEELQKFYQHRGIELVEVASGYRFQVRADYGQLVGGLWEERPSRYSRALLETLALIAYRQPITRGEIEEVRGVAVSTTIMKTLLERGWVRVIGHRDLPGRPGLYATTRSFLDYFNLSSLEALPPLADIKNLELLLGAHTKSGGADYRAPNQATEPQTT